jgi:hypothetical protein
MCIKIGTCRLIVCTRVTRALASPLEGDKVEGSGILTLRAPLSAAAATGPPVLLSPALVVAGGAPSSCRLGAGGSGSTSGSRAPSPPGVSDGSATLGVEQVDAADDARLEAQRQRRRGGGNRALTV